VMPLATSLASCNMPQQVHSSFLHTMPSCWKLQHPDLLILSSAVGHICPTYLTSIFLDQQSLLTHE